MTVARSLAWMGMAQLLGVLLQLVSQIVLARTLTLHDTGVYAVALATIGSLSLMQLLSLQSLLIRERELSVELERTVFTLNAGFAVLLAVIVLTLGKGGALFLGDPAVQQVLTALAVTPLIQIFSFMPLALLERDGRFREIALATSSGNIASAFVTIAAALAGQTYMSAAYGQWALALVTLGVTLILASTAPARRPSLRAWRGAGAFAAQMFLIGGVSGLSQRLSEMILPRFLGLPALGLYSRAGGLNGLLWLNAHLFVGRVMLVDFVSLVRRGESLRERYRVAVDTITILLWPMFAGFAVIAGPFIYHVFGPRWIGATIPLVFLLASSMVHMMSTMVWELFTATDQLGRQARIETIRAATALAVFIAGCAISVEAAAASRIFDALFALAIYRPHLNRMTDTRMIEFLPVLLRNLSLTGLAIAPAAGLMSLNSWAPNVGLLPLAVAIFAGAALWVFALILLQHPAVEVIFSALRGARHAQSRAEVARAHDGAARP